MYFLFPTNNFHMLVHIFPTPQGLFPVYWNTWKHSQNMICSYSSMHCFLNLLRLPIGVPPAVRRSSGLTLTLQERAKDSFAIRSVDQSPSGEQWMSTVTQFSYARSTRCTSGSTKASVKSAREKVPSCESKRTIRMPEQNFAMAIFMKHYHVNTQPEIKIRSRY